MPASSEERRRIEAALVRAVDVNPDVGAPTTYSALCAYVDVLAGDGFLPEAVIIAFKAVLARSESLKHSEAEAREQLRSALVSTCIQRYFTGRIPDDVSIVRASPLRLVRDDSDQPHRTASPDVPA